MYVEKEARMKEDISIMLEFHAFGIVTPCTGDS